MNVILVFVKNPEPGRVKTRLARSVGPDAAASLYRRMAERAIREAKRVRGARVWALFDPPDRAPEVRAWLGRGVRYVPQTGGDLGKRLRAAFDCAFSAGAERVLAIGSDCPRLRSPALADALDALSGVDVVIGPARDGGYYLIGLRRARPALFRGIAWSTRKVCRQTVAVIRRLRLSWRELPMLSDVDRGDDLQAAGAALR